MLRNYLHTADAPGLTKLGAAEIFEPLGPIPWLVQGLDFCPGPPNLIAGPGFSGKTLACQELAIAVATGRLAWGRYATRSGRVLHLDYEQGRRLTFARYQQLARAASIRPVDLAGLHVACMPSLYLDMPGAEAVLVREVTGYALVIVDSFRVSVPTLDENSSTLRSVLDMLHRVSDATGTTIVVVHHSRKGRGDGASGSWTDIRGSSTVFEACSSVLLFGERSGDATKGTRVQVLHKKARTSGCPAAPFALRIYGVEIDGDAAGGIVVRVDVDGVPRTDGGGHGLEQMVGELRELLKREGELRGQDKIAKKLGRNAEKVRSALHKLVDAGEVEALGNGRSRRYRTCGG